MRRRWPITCAAAQVSRMFTHAPACCRVLSRVSSPGGRSGLIAYLTDVATSGPGRETVVSDLIISSLFAEIEKMTAVVLSAVRRVVPKMSEGIYTHKIDKDGLNN